MITWLVIVYPARFSKNVRDQVMYASSSSVAPTVQMIGARTAEDAAELAKIQPGCHALIVEKGKTRRFDRAEQAPLAEKTPDGNPCDIAEAA